MELKKRIYYHDTDCGGVVYYANYLKYIEEARTLFFEERGISIKELAQEDTLFVVARQQVEYKFPSFYGDTLEIGARIGSLSVSKIEFVHEIKNQDARIICNAQTTLVCVDKRIKPKAIPEELKKNLI